MQVCLFPFCTASECSNVSFNECNFLVIRLLFHHCVQVNGNHILIPPPKKINIYENICSIELAQLVVDAAKINQCSKIHVNHKLYPQAVFVYMNMYHVHSQGQSVFTS